MKLRDLIIFGIIVIGIIFFFQWRISKLEEKISSQNSTFTNGFQQLSDSLSAKSETQVVYPPNFWQELFHTEAAKEYEKIREMIPGVIRKEVDKIKVQPGGTTVINKASILIEGDSVVFRNEDGIITRIAKVMPINGDSSILVVVPQEIEVTSVDVRPDPNRQDSLLFFLSAINKTTGDTLKVDKAISYVIPEKTKKWRFGIYPSIGTSYDILNKEWIVKGGITPILFKGKRVDAEILGVELSYGLKNTPGIEVNILNLQLKKRRY